MTAALVFPAGFLWGAATAAHQVEGDNTNSDWWEWEHRAGSPVPEPSGRACEHYTRYADDVKLLADAGLNTYRYSVEWARVEPAEGEFDEAQLDHYVRMTDVVRAAGLTPVVTLHHFTLPQWLAARGGWTDQRTPELFGRYCERVVRHLGGRVDWFCTINEPGNVAVGGYLGVFGWPPGSTSYDEFRRAADGLTNGHRAALRAVKSVRPEARVGLTHGMQEWTANAAGRSPMREVRRMFEDIYLEASADDDFVGVQTYTRERVGPQGLVGPEPGVPTTIMGYEFWPEALEATIRRAWAYTGGTPILVTENGIATAEDAERVAYVRRALEGVLRCLADGIEIGGYTYWSLLDNFEWALGYGPTFGLVSVDRETQERVVKDSARWLGRVARANALVD